MNTVVELAARAALSTKPTIYATYTLSNKLDEDSVLGDFVECGVFAGAQLAAMAAACPERIIHAFDSFCGIPEAGEKDDETITGLIGRGEGRLISTGISACSLEQVKKNLLSWGLELDRFRFYEGWFQETVPVCSENIPPIALLRLDGDLYESTLVCMQHLYPKLVEGGYLIIDDYALTGCRRAIHDYFNRNTDDEFTSIEGGLGPVYQRISRRSKEAE